MAVSLRSDTRRRDPDIRTASGPAGPAPAEPGSTLARSIDARAYQDVPRAVAAMPKAFADGESTGWHSHPRALIERATELPVMYDPRGTDGLVMRLLLAELARLPTLPLSLPWPSDPALAALCARLADEPDVERDVASLAASLGIGARTLARRFVAQTGLSPGQWRQRMRALEAVGRLAGGASVPRVALELGYDSPSAFSAMFRRVLDATPSALARTLA
jgi:AraC-like DNA-binding protein